MLELRRKTIDNFFVSVSLRDYIPARFAMIPALSPSMHYSHALFEGMSIIEREGRLGLFHPALNFERLRSGVECMGWEWMGYSDAQMAGAIFSLVALNGWHKGISLEGKDVEVEKAGKKVRRIYVRPLVYVKNNAIGLASEMEPELLLALVPMGAYVEGGEKKGICTMMFPCPRELPFPQVKTASNYQLSIYARRKLAEFNSNSERKCQESIFRNRGGVITEGSGENVLMVKGNELLTPAPGEGALPGITLRLVSRIAEKLGMDFKYANFTLEDVSSADALFFTGNAAGVVPIAAIAEVDESYKLKKWHEVTEGAENRYMKAIKEEYEKMETWQGHEGMHAFMDEWLDSAEADRLLEAAEWFRFMARATYSQEYCTCTPFNPEPKSSAPPSFEADSRKLLEEFGMKNFLG